MKRILALFGIVSLFLPLVTEAAGSSVFEKIGAMVQVEQDVPDDVVQFAALSVNTWSQTAFPNTPLSLTSDDVRTVLRSVVPNALCSRLPGELQKLWSCPAIEEQIKSVVAREMEILRLGHQLQVTATHYEDPIAAFSLQPQDMAASYLETLQVWGMPLTLSGAVAHIRLLRPPAPATESIVSQLGFSLGLLSAEQRIAAVWRYRYGLAFVQKDDTTKSVQETENPDGQSGPGTERQYLFKRVPDLEQVLQQLRDMVLSTVASTLQPGDTAIALLPVPTTMPDGTPFSGGNDILAWVSVWQPAGPGAGVPLLPPVGDVGLQWKTALDPVLPSLLRQDGTPILGGTYPPAPERQNSGEVLAKGGSGLCESLSWKQGFLCRSRTRETDQSGHCLESPPEPKDGTIILSPCTPPSSSASSSAASSTSISSSSSSSVSTADICAGLRAASTSSSTSSSASSATSSFSSTSTSSSSQSSSGSSAPAQPCEPGGESPYPYTVLGHACFIRECAVRTYGHTIVPRREPLVSQEPVSPWEHCRQPVPQPDPFILPATVSLPVFPAYNPAARARELLLDYCQNRARPPLLPPVLCQTAPSASLSLTSVLRAFTALSLTREADNQGQMEILQAAEGRGMDRGTALYSEYLRQVSATLNGTMRTTVEILQRLAQSTFPTTLCPLNPQEDLSVCKE